MQPNNLTALDFDDIKSSIKTYLRTRSEFSDYDFEGSGLSYLIDTLAYNTYYSAFNANMSMNEAFLPSATLRDNIVNIAKLLNYVPRSITCSKACLKLHVQTSQTNGAYPSSITLSKGPVASGGNFIWNILSDTTVEVNTTSGIAEFDNLMINEGTIVDFEYTVSSFENQNYIVPAEEADINTLVVTVKPNEASTTSDLYNLVDTVTNLTAATRVYFISEGEDQRYEILMGDGVLGKKVDNNTRIEVSYLTTSGPDSNGVKSFIFSGVVENPNGVSPNAFDVVVSSLGDAKSLEGGVLLMTPLRDASGDYFAMAQGPISIGGFNIETQTGEKVRQNVALVGRVPNGAILEKKVKTNNFDPSEPLRFILKSPDVTTATNFANVINTSQNNQIANALDPSLIEITYPEDVQSSWAAMQFIAGIETLIVETGNKARVVINERSGTVVVGGNVVLDEVMISHGSISIHTKVTPLVSQPEAFAEGETVVAEQTTTEVAVEETGTIGVIPGTTSVSELAVALSDLGVKPRDIIAIFQAIKETGALQADLVII